MEKSHEKSNKSSRRKQSLPKMTGGLFDGRCETTGKTIPLSVSKSVPLDRRNESQHQIEFFGLLKLNQPKPPLVARINREGRRVTEENLNDRAYLSHPFYVLTRIRHFPNGGYLLDGRQSLRLKAEGLRRGAFDIYLDAARRGYHGLRFEFKVNDNDLSPEQEEERRWLLAENYAVHTVWHNLEGLALLAWYLDIPVQKFRGYPTSPHAVRLPAKGGHDERCNCRLRLGAVAPFLVRQRPASL